MGIVARSLALTAAALALTLGLSACVGATPAPEVTKTPTATAVPDDNPTPTPAPPAEPVFVPGGTAEENKPIFDLANQNYFTQVGSVIPEGRGVIDNLVSVGFDKAAMQITPDRTAINLPVDSLIFSVLLGEECLVGQYSASGYSTILAPKLTTGSCLIGRTRTIDW
ncbi:hypothetical protein QMG83_10025 [Salinibacterium sp. G-O1]|uniref:DUF6993 domain-containing protein n=1 Tax=Salinibacterium sp. G-O1 TaxID=3046208 RepID=UPI0024BBAE60|nr:hypothetical protein [Salinibacterium sp. G-O1]MDJ0335559.1 hypothetical protein [Salinibacterium sp. G-O1]